jgi:hypothetical protein
MPTYPYKPTKLSENEKKAYRYLLYTAMVDIRNRLCESPNRFSLNPLRWHKKYGASRSVGGLADWLHNLAEHSTTDFTHFNAERFWADFKTYYLYYADIYNGPDYGEVYQDKLANLESLPVPFYDYAMEEPTGEIVTIGRMYCLLINSFTPSDWEKLRNIYRPLPHFIEDTALPSWFGANTDSEFHLIASVEPSGIEITGFLPLADWLEL